MQIVCKAGGESGAEHLHLEPATSKEHGLSGMPHLQQAKHANSTTIEQQRLLPR